MESKTFRVISLTMAGVSLVSVISLAAILLQPTWHFYAKSPSNDGYVAPRDIGALVEATQESTVTVECDQKGDKNDAFGSGWAIDESNLEVPIKDGFKSAVITNYHVVDSCIENGFSGISVAKFLGKSFDAYVMKYDEENDLVLLGTKARLFPLELSPWAPLGGYWVMAVGAADGYEGSISIGSVLNETEYEVLITNSISSGNSGGPLVDNMGLVVGTVTWGAVGEQYNGAKSLDAMCKAIIRCPGKYFWERE